MHFFADMFSSNLVISLAMLPQFELFVLDRRLGGGRGWERYFHSVFHFIFIKSVFLAPVIIKCMEKNLDTTKSRYSEHIFPVP